MKNLSLTMCFFLMLLSLSCFFENTPNTIVILTPSSTQHVETGSTFEITWDQDNYVSNVFIELYKNNAFHENLTRNTINSGSFSWDVPWDLEVGSDYYLRIYDLDYPSLNRGRSELFSISPKDNVFTAGYSNGSGNSNWVIKRFSSDGHEDTIHWNKSIEGAISADTTDVPYKVVLDSNYNVYIAGHVQNETGQTAIQISKFNIYGIEDPQWPLIIESDQYHNQFYQLFVDSLDRIVLMGYGEDLYLRRYFSDKSEDLTYNLIIKADTDDSRVITTANAILTPDDEVIIFCVSVLTAGGSGSSKRVSSKMAPPNPTLRTHLQKVDSAGVIDPLWGQVLFGGRNPQKMLLDADKNLYVLTGYRINMSWVSYVCKFDSNGLTENSWTNAGVSSNEIAEPTILLNGVGELIMIGHTPIEPYEFRLKRFDNTGVYIEGSEKEFSFDGTNSQGYETANWACINSSDNIFVFCYVNLSGVDSVLRSIKADGTEVTENQFKTTLHIDGDDYSRSLAIVK